MTITVISFDRKIIELQRLLKNYKQLPKELKEFFNQCDYFVLKRQELLIYKERACVYSCSFDNVSRSIKQITKVILTYVFDKNGLIYSHENCTEYGQAKIRA